MGTMAVLKPMKKTDEYSNYAYRTQSYMIGGHNFNPSLMKMDPQKNRTTSKYSGISRQYRWSGMIFHHPDTIRTDLENTMSAVFPEIVSTHPATEDTPRGGRPQHSVWGSDPQKCADDTTYSTSPWIESRVL